MDVQQIYTLEKWDIDEENDYKQLVPSKIREKVLHCLSQGLSGMATCDMLIPCYIENSDIEAIGNCLDYFEDISEESLIKVLIYLTENHLLYDDQDTPKRNDLVEKVLSIPFTTILLLPHIKTNLSNFLHPFLREPLCKISSQLLVESLNSRLHILRNTAFSNRKSCLLEKEITVHSVVEEEIIPTDAQRMVMQITRTTTEENLEAMPLARAAAADLIMEIINCK
ncbi:hypothetical protein Trydic_g17056 [Trypoxylus dichotomus]